MQHAFQIEYFRGAKPQRLSNVVLFSPSLLLIERGSKGLYWQGQRVDLGAKLLLAGHSRQQLTFENMPLAQGFKSQMLLFFVHPEPELLALSRASASLTPWFGQTKGLKASLSFLTSMDKQAFSLDAQQQFVFGLYQQLAELGVLHWMFPSGEVTVAQRVAELAAQQPAHNALFALCCQRLGMSRATLLRHLKADQLRFRDIVAQVRMNHAISLMQRGERQLEHLSDACGYQSLPRFQARFEGQFGLSVSEYLATLS
ncbi:AraC family transcriptional regulator [Shewanella sp. 3B26]|uniref:AraC family transcriptional regulator n=1 Tax=Shewanella zhuhaiensis TaxID=2919576 RepID=A0AAJ1EYV7_9GAMM|nr:AraC family transcriptional regulator [Shewanella zhuhaiensis]MCH4295459.1 AraC family transcriptional regulator [Shewanella zhuhaiensis]